MKCKNFLPWGLDYPRNELLYRNALCEVAWLVDISAQSASGVIREKLKGNYMQDW